MNITFVPQFRLFIILKHAIFLITCVFRGMVEWICVHFITMEITLLCGFVCFICLMQGHRKSANWTARGSLCCSIFEGLMHRATDV